MTKIMEALIMFVVLASIEATILDKGRFRKKNCVHRTTVI